MRTLGLDTSNYTTSAAVFDGAQGQNCSRLLGVAPGQLGLRQSDALFAHTRQLPERFAALFDAAGHDEPICAVGASTRPRAVEGSYMPCFLAGETLGRCIASVLDVPFYAVSHQQGHIAAALWSTGRLDLMQTPHLAWHLSGGTTELLLVTPEGKNVHAERIGGTSDLSAGQVMDRTGKLLGLPFPSGKALDELSGGSDCGELFRVKLDGLQFSLSGLENKIAQFHAQGHDDGQTARYAVASVCHAVCAVTAAARKAYPGLTVVFSGGVASNSMLRARCAQFAPVFAQPQYSTDNAMGVAVLTYLQEAH